MRKTRTSSSSGKRQGPRDGSGRGSRVKKHNSVKTQTTDNRKRTGGFKAAPTTTPKRTGGVKKAPTRKTPSRATPSRKRSSTITRGRTRQTMRR